MTTAGVQDRDMKAAEYLQSLRSMTDELERAMQAIARNALREFEESIDSQQVLSARLARLADDLCAPLVAKPDDCRGARDFRCGRSSSVRRIGRRWWRRWGW